MSTADLTRVPEFYHGYINLVSDEDIYQAFQNNSDKCIHFFESLPAEKVNYKYAEGKWTIKEVLQHIIDAERIFSYRALCFARNEIKSLPGFDENEYANNARVENRNWEDVLEEFKIVRKSSALLFNSFDEIQLNANGISNENSISVLGIGYIIIGHALHHIKIIKERYL